MEFLVGRKLHQGKIRLFSVQRQDKEAPRNPISVPLFCWASCVVSFVLVLLCNIRLQPQIQVLHPRPITVRLSRRVLVTGATSREILSLNDSALLLFFFQHKLRGLGHAQPPDIKWYFFPTQCIHNARNEINLLCTSVPLSGAASGQDFPGCY